MNKPLNNYWFGYQKFYGKDVMEFVKTKNLEEWIISSGESIHLDIFIKDKKAPTIVFSHGMAGYGRMLAPYAYILYNEGFNIVLPDLIGYGQNKGKKGHWQWKQLIENLIDSCKYASSEINNNNVFLAGGSMGGVLAYHAVCHGAPVKALTSYCLFDFQDHEFIRDASSYGILTPLVYTGLNVLSKLFPNYSIPASRVSSYDNLSSNQEFNDLVKNDPLGGNKLTLRAVYEMTNAKLPIPFEEYDIVPILVIQPAADKMTPARFTRKSYDRLGIANKKYLEIEERGHWVIDKEGVALICNEMAQWFKKYLN